MPRALSPLPLFFFFPFFSLAAALKDDECENIKRRQGGDGVYTPIPTSVPPRPPPFPLPLPFFSFFLQTRSLKLPPLQCAERSKRELRRSRGNVGRPSFSPLSLSFFFLKTEKDHDRVSRSFFFFFPIAAAGIVVEMIIKTKETTTTT